MATSAGRPPPGAHPPHAPRRPDPEAAPARRGRRGRSVDARSTIRPVATRIAADEVTDDETSTAAQPDELRPITFERDFTELAAGSVLVSFGRTKVLCTASIDDDVPRWMRGKGKGWVTAEYSMLPGSSAERIGREAARTASRPAAPRRSSGSSAGRCAPVCDMKALGERQVIVDCDVLQADGGTRTASICGGYVALHDALTRRRADRRRSADHPLVEACAAISVGIIDGTPDARPALRRGRPGRGRHERRDDRRRPVHRGAGHGRGPAVQPPASSTTCSAWPRAASPRSPRCRREVVADTAASPRSPVSSRCGWCWPPPTRTRSAEIAALLGDRLRAGAPPGRRPRRGRGRRHPRGQRPAQGRRRSRDATGEPAVADDTGLEVDALGGAPGVRVRPLRRRGRHRRRQRGQAARRARRRPTARAAHGPLPDASPWCAAPTAARSSPRASVEGHIARGRRGDGRLRLRPGLRARRRERRPDVRRDDPGREARRSATAAGRSAPSPPRSIRRRDRRAPAGRPPVASPAAEVDGPGVDDLVVADDVHALVVGDGRVDVGGASSARDRRPSGSGRRPRRRTSCARRSRTRRRPPSTVGLPWSMPSALSPPSATAQPPARFDRDDRAPQVQRLAERHAGCAVVRCPSACTSPACSSVTQLVDVPGAGAAARDDVAADLVVRGAAASPSPPRPCRPRSSGSVMRWPS